MIYSAATRLVDTHWRAIVVLLFTALLTACGGASDDTRGSGSGGSEANPKITVELGASGSSTITSLTLGQTFTLATSAAASTGASDDNPLYIEIVWSIVSKPPNSRALIENPSSNAPTFRPDVEGEYVLKVVISQGGAVLVEKEITINAGVDDLFPIKPDNHLATTDDCLACHNNQDWNIAPIVDHTQVYGVCSSCHNGLIATGVSVNHIGINEECDICHSINNWLVRFDHNAVIGPCVECHQGSIAQGKSATHITTTDLCEACHFPILFSPVARIDHSQVLGSCASCHNNVIAGGLSTNHIAINEDCSGCHNVIFWLPATGTPAPSPGPVLPDPLPPRIDHTGFVGNCLTCHNGVDASGMSNSHPNSTTRCEACHGLPPQSWYTYLRPLAHTEALGTCVSCHGNGIAMGKPQNHIQSSDFCEQCHSTVSWLNAIQLPPAPGPVFPAPFDHTGIVAGCINCHDGIQASGQNVGHVRTNLDCSSCHTTISWLNPFADAPAPSPIDHSGFVGSCVLCHNGVTASGKTSNHINSTDACDACHLLSPALWIDVLGLVDHTQVLGTCVTCHDGVIASGKSVRHAPSTDLCETCHAIWPSPWIPVTPIAFDHSQAVGVCSICHAAPQTSSAGVVHPVSNEECNACHSTATWLVPLRL